MDSKENIVSGVTVIRAEAPSNYHVAQRSDPPPPPHQTASVPPSGVAALTTSPVFVGSMDRKKRGRPRKYGPDGSGQKLSMPVSMGNCSSGKRGRGRSAPSETKHQQRIQMPTTGDEFGSSDGANFTPHVITVNVGEDVTAKIVSFCQQGPRAICILSANGMISNATLRQSDSSGGTLTYEVIRKQPLCEIRTRGRFEIVNLCGSFTPTEREGTIYRAGGLSVSLSSPNGQVVGGSVAGLLIAASPVQIIVGSFLPSTSPEVKLMKPKVQQPSSSHSPFTITAALPPPSNMEKESCNNGQGHNSSSLSSMQNLPSQATVERGNWPHTHSMQERRMSTTDINISLPEGMQ